MGNKAGYAETILWTLGLRAGHGADAYLWAEADEDVAALLRCYPDAAMLRAVADIIRGWKDEEPRALWERLRAERKARGPRVDAEGTAGWMSIVRSSAKPGAETSGFCTHAGRDDQPPRDIGTVADRCDTLAEHADVARWTALQGGASYAAPITLGPDGATQPAGGVTLDGNREPGGSHPGTWPGSVTDACHRLAEYAQIANSNRLINVAGPDLRNTGKGGTTFGGVNFAKPAALLADRFEAVAEQVAAHAVEHAGTHPGGGDFRGLHVRRPNVDGFIPNREGLADRFDAAATVLLHKWSFSERGPEHGYGGPGSIVKPGNHQWTTENRDQSIGCERTAGRVDKCPAGWPPVAVLPRIPAACDVARWLGTPGDLAGCVVYMDPPYLDTTGYQHNLSREEVVSIAVEYAVLGAHVAISEATPLPELVALGWHVADITAGRKGQKRTFSKQQGEYLTMNRPAAYAIPTQIGMFG